MTLPKIALERVAVESAIDILYVNIFNIVKEKVKQWLVIILKKVI